MSAIRVERQRSGGVAVVTLDRPDQRNALSVEMLDDIAKAFGDLAVKPEVRAVVLAGDGPDFCAGADFAELEQARAGGAGIALDFDAPFREALAAIATHPVPVVAKIQGRALGGGCQLVLACSLAVAAEDAVIGIPSARLGIVIPFDSVERLVLAVGPRRAGEMLFTARTVTGAEALAWGLVNRAVPADGLDAATDALTAAIVEAAPLSVRASKRGVDLVVEGLAAAVHAGGGHRRAEFDMMAAEALGSEDLAEGIAAFRERRRPEFGGR